MFRYRDGVNQPRDSPPYFQLSTLGLQVITLALQVPAQFGIQIGLAQARVNNLQLILRIRCYGIRTAIIQSCHNRCAHQLLFVLAGEQWSQARRLASAVAERQQSPAPGR